MTTRGAQLAAAEAAAEAGGMAAKAALGALRAGFMAQDATAGELSAVAMGGTIEAVGGQISQAEQSLIEQKALIDAYEKAEVESFWEIVQRLLDPTKEYVGQSTADARAELFDGYEELDAFERAGIDDLWTIVQDRGKEIIDWAKGVVDDAEKVIDSIKSEVYGWIDPLFEKVNSAIAYATSFMADRLEDLLEIPARVLFSLIRDFFFEEVKEE